MRVPAPAKINLHLRVGPPRGDGYHPLLTWMVTAGLFDTLTFVRHAGRADAPDATGGTTKIFALSCSDPGLPTDADANLVTRVALALADAADSRVGEGSTARARTAPLAMETGAVSAFLVKRIPPGAGLAGGSSDAVATLLALNRLWKLDWSRDRLARFGERFGSDLSFFFAETGSAVCTGRGEIVRPIDPPDTSRRAVLVLPKFSLSTPDVYRRFDEMKLGSESDVGEEPDFANWSKLPAKDLMPRLVNDLEPPAFSLRPELGELRSALEKNLARVFRMSGSGSSLFSLCEASDEATSLARRVTDEMNVDAMGVQIAPAVKWESSGPQASDTSG